RNTDPELRASLLERLIDLHELGADGSDTRALLEELLTLRPEHSAAMLSLGRLHFETGELAEARQLWRLDGEQLPADDLRFYRPALEQAREALEAGELEDAEGLANRAHALEPDEPEPLEWLALIASARAEHRRAAEVLGERLRIDDELPRARKLDASARAEFELRRAAALAACF